MPAPPLILPYSAGGNCCNNFTKSLRSNVLNIGCKHDAESSFPHIHSDIYPCLLSLSLNSPLHALVPICKFNIVLYCSGREQLPNNLERFVGGIAIITLSFLFKGASSLSNDDIKLSERLYIPGKRLRGFETGKIGPKDGNDFIGGNYVSSINASTTIPTFLENVQSVDVVLFADAANIWGVDYDSSLDKNGIRSSVGIGIDWLTPVGPLTFSFAQPITKEPSDIEETFRFNIGTSF